MHVRVLKSDNPTPSYRPTKFVHLLSEYVSEETISPFACIRVQHSIQVLFGDSLRVNDVSHTLNTLQSLQGSQQHL